MCFVDLTKICCNVQMMKKLNYIGVTKKFILTYHNFI